MGLIDRIARAVADRVAIGDVEPDAPPRPGCPNPDCDAGPDRRVDASPLGRTRTWICGACGTPYPEDSCR